MQTLVMEPNTPIPGSTPDGPKPRLVPPFTRSPRPSLSPLLHALILLGALPLIMPSLIVAKLTAKRWGRIPAWMIFFDAVVLLIVVAALPRLLPLWMAAAACVAFLAVRRAWEGKAERGIFLGYSDLVAWGFILGGALAFYGLFKSVPLSTMSRALSVERRIEARAGAIANDGVRPGQKVTLVDPQPDWDQRVIASMQDGRLLLSDLATPPNAPLKTWVPLKDGERKVWLVLAAGAPSVPRPIEGWLDRASTEEVDAILTLERDRFAGQALSDNQFVITLGPKAGDPKGAPREETDADGLPWLIVGAAVSLLAIAKAVGE